MAKLNLDEVSASAGTGAQRSPQPSLRPLDTPDVNVATATGDGRRRFSIYSPMAAFDLVDELDFLTRRSIDQNVFFSPQFLVPAMPRLDERKVRLMVIRDEAAARSRLRLLMPFSIERSGLIGGPSAIRAWTHPFGPLGTILVDADDPDGTLASLFETLARPDLRMPDVLILPDLRVGEPMADALLRVAAANGLPVVRTAATDRAAMVKGPDAATYLDRALSPKRRRDAARQRRILERRGEVTFEIAREPDAVRHALEEFLVLEASGWKGEVRSALVMDRYRSAFTREAVNALAEKDRTRIFTLRAGGQPVASLVAFVLGGEAFAWKTGYDENFAAASPGLQLMLHVTEALIADPDVARADSCTVPDHTLMNRVWKERIDIATYVVGLSPDAGARVEAAAKGVTAMKRSRNLARLMRERLQSIRIKRR
ncbi:GNAT family N-acetyltransferase [Mangrovicella endophytica]|uniref:GNAT family N-acetyltransferase n=1 Tax=Mangrovicella endophytica TaxID=2066697 RepID=UPI000C9E40DB|nr:GNAT family N-acetyltransferase [Mangrovicella endophytica]